MQIVAHEQPNAKQGVIAIVRDHFQVPFVSEPID